MHAPAAHLLAQEHTSEVLLEALLRANRPPPRLSWLLYTFDAPILLPLSLGFAKWCCMVQPTVSCWIGT